MDIWYSCNLNLFNNIHLDCIVLYRPTKIIYQETCFEGKLGYSAGIAQRSSC